MTGTECGAVKLLTRTGLDWTGKYPPIARAVASLGARLASPRSACMVQLASDAGNAAGLVLFLFDLLRLDGEDLAARPLVERKARLAKLLALTIGWTDPGRSHPFHAVP